jgi:hypothetical protein
VTTLEATADTSPVLPRPATFLEAALSAAGRGWRVFPLHPQSKIPAIKRWEQRATNDPATILRWWEYHPEHNVAVACGPSGLLVLDLDAARGPVPARWAALGVDHGRDVVALLAARAHQSDPVDTFTVATPRGGEHRYFLLPQGSRIRSTVGARGRGLGFAADTRGPGALVAAPGSVQKVNGELVPYTVVRDVPVAPLDDWLATILTPPPPPHRSRSVPDLPATSRRVAAYVQAAIAGETRSVATAGTGERHIAVYAAAAALGELLGNGWITEAAIAHHITTAARRHVGVDEFTWRELTTTIRDGIAAGREHPRALPERPAR